MVKPDLILPVGTQVVTRVELPQRGAEPGHAPGAVGVIVHAPADQTHAYRVRLADGHEIPLKRNEFAIRKEYQQAGLERAADMAGDLDLRPYVIYRCVIGSRAYGLAGADSDTDRRGIYLPPADLHWSLFGVPEQLEDDATQECYWEVRKFLDLALKANPNVLECLYSPLVEHATPLARELLEMRAAFLSKLVYQTYNGYVLSQFKKLEGDLRNHGAIKWKHAMHLIRLLLSGVTVLHSGFVPLDVQEHRARLLAVRQGEVPWEEVNAWRLELHRAMDAALATTPLPDQPDYARVNAFLIKARRSMVGVNGGGE